MKQRTSTPNSKHSKRQGVRFLLRKSQEERIEIRSKAMQPQRSMTDESSSMAKSWTQQDVPTNQTHSDNNYESSDAKPLGRYPLRKVLSSVSGSVRSLYSSSRSITSSVDSTSDCIIPNGVKSRRVSYARRSNHGGSYHGLVEGSAARILERAGRADEAIQHVVESYFVALVSPEECVIDTMKNVDISTNSVKDDAVVLGEGSFGRVISVNEVRLRDRQFHRRRHNRVQNLRIGTSHSEKVDLEINNAIIENEPSETERNSSIASPKLKRQQSFVSLKVDEMRKNLTLEKGQTHIRSESKLSDCFSTSNNSSMHSSSSESRGALQVCFAMKKCKRIKDYEASAEAAIDMAAEACLLAKLSHPNICKLHAISTRPVLSSGFFILLEYLPCTLQKKWLTWKNGRSSLEHYILTLQPKKARVLMNERINGVAVGIASALKHLHDRNIIYRDLKRDNVGFSTDGVVKLFDFGLSKELPPDNDEEETFSLTRVGAPRYMAPEIVASQPYNKKADVYSFAILLWEICSLKEAFSGQYCDKHFEKVLKGARPRLLRWWPKELKEMLQSCWLENITERMSFELIVQGLKSILNV